MRIRCGSCHGEFWIALSDAEDEALRISCPTCQSDYVLHVPNDAAKFQARLAARAFTLVRLKELDLPSAYSVLLGVMTLDEIPDLAAVCPRPPPTSPTPPAPDVAPPPPREASRGMPFDPAFRYAVEAGHLTPAQAMQRGIRSRYIDTLAARYELPKALAEEVADNRIALLEALRIYDPEPVPPVKRRVGGASRPRRWDRRILAAAFTIAVMVWILSPHPESPPAGPPEASGPAQMWSVRGADVLVDGYGRVMKVSAAEAETVLTAFCAAHEPRQYIAVEAVRAEGGDAPDGTRLGLLRRVGSSELLSIALSEDPDSKRWNAGDGFSLLEPKPAPTAAAARISGR